MALTDFELDRLEAARLNSVCHRQQSPNKKLMQLAFEEIEFLRSELLNAGQALAVGAEHLVELSKRKCRVAKPEGMRE